MIVLRVMIVLRMFRKFINETHSFAKYLLSTGYVPSIVQWSEGTKINKTG